ncbi:MAG TPA: glycosyltransferase family 1 protein [Alphaproteobacteria bacterium]|jgi:glycosyltransferase involved in cell wall biosynthesis|nr:glycosyltransferase family 1 protein [Alphaproteobacteria bacterium]
MNSTYFIYTGNAYPHKNLSRLIDAVIMLKVKLKIVSGKNVFTERLAKEIKNKNASKFVELLGFQTDKELEKLYKNSIAFVFPTLSEGFGLPPMEAINAGTLVVLSDIPVLKEVYAESGIYFDPFDVNSIAETLDKVAKISDTERRNKIIFAQKFVKKYSWEKMARETLKVYETSSK